jgi:hypothetical protein
MTFIWDAIGGAVGSDGLGDSSDVCLPQDDTTPAAIPSAIAAEIVFFKFM